MKRIALACAFTAVIFGALALSGFEDAKIGFAASFVLAVACAVVLLLRPPREQTTAEELEESLHKR